MKKVVIAIDSFKGCLSSVDAGNAAKLGVQRVFPQCKIDVIRIADGGEGILDLLLEQNLGKKIAVQAHSPIMELKDSHYGISQDGSTAYIEMASISGLNLVPTDKRNPMLTTSYGTGELIRDALERLNCRSFVIGIGGSATNDAGMGMLQALGFRFFDAEGNEIGIDHPISGVHLAQIKHIDDRDALPALRDAHFTIACDVRNPFYGPSGAAHAYARQKGADGAMVELLDAGLKSLADLVLQQKGIDLAQIAGTGAAGGMGGGMLAFLRAELKPGIELMLEQIGFDRVIEAADLIITGEGKADAQSLMGKVPQGVLKVARKHQIPIVLIAGSIEDGTALSEAGFATCLSICTGPISLEQAMDPSYARQNISNTIEQICRLKRAFA